MGPTKVFWGPRLPKFKFGNVYPPLVLWETRLIYMCCSIVTSSFSVLYLLLLAGLRKNVFHQNQHPIILSISFLMRYSSFLQNICWFTSTALYINWTCWQHHTKTVNSVPSAPFFFKTPYTDEQASSISETYMSCFPSNFQSLMAINETLTVWHQNLSVISETGRSTMRILISETHVKLSPFQFMTSSLLTAINGTPDSKECRPLHTFSSGQQHHSHEGATNSF